MVGVTLDRGFVWLLLDLVDTVCLPHLIFGAFGQSRLGVTVDHEPVSDVLFDLFIRPHWHIEDNDRLLRIVAAAGAGLNLRPIPQDTDDLDLIHRVAVFL